MLKEVSDFLELYFLIVVEQCVFGDKPIRLGIIRIFFYLNLNKEGSLLPQKGSLQVLILIDIYFRAPWRGHVKCLGQKLQLLFLFGNLVQLNYSIITLLSSISWCSSSPMFLKISSCSMMYSQLIDPEMSKFISSTLCFGYI